MNKLSYEEVDELTTGLRHRSDLAKYVPAGREMLAEQAHEFWRDVLARMERGEWADAITAIERRFEPRDKAPWVIAQKMPVALRARVAA